MSMTHGGEFTCAEQCLECTLSQSCTDPSLTGLPSALHVARCDCKVKQFYSCQYVPGGPCVDSPYFPMPL
jgi:hypothetical protein